jgi:hypothetical protein
MEEEIEHKINMLNSSDFYNAIDNNSLPKYIRASQNKLYLFCYHRLFKELSLSLMKEDVIYEHRSILDKKHKCSL